MIDCTCHITVATIHQLDIRLYDDYMILMMILKVTRKYGYNLIYY